MIPMIAGTCDRCRRRIAETRVQCWYGCLHWQCWWCAEWTLWESLEE